MYQIYLLQLPDEIINYVSKFLTKVDIQHPNAKIITHYKLHETNSGFLQKFYRDITRGLPIDCIKCSCFGVGSGLCYHVWANKH